MPRSTFARPSAIAACVITVSCASPVCDDDPTAFATTPIAPPEVQMQPRPLPKHSASALLAHHAQEAPRGELYPRLECYEQHGAETFMKQLATGALNRDKRQLRDLSAADMRYLYFNHPVLDWGREEWFESLAAPDGKAWEQLVDLVSLGCASTYPGQFVIPWYAGQASPAGGRFGHALVVGNGVPVFAPDARKREGWPKSASWEWVELIAGSYSRLEILQRVRLANGTEGLIDPRRMRPASGFQIVVERRGRDWVIVDYLLAGSGSADPSGNRAAPY